MAAVPELIDHFFHNADLAVFSILEYGLDLIAIRIVDIYFFT